jgi:hypothetical protein
MKARYLYPSDYYADPAPHVFGGQLYVYPSHDRESGIPENDNGDHFDMRDYHVVRMSDPENGAVQDFGPILSVPQIPWAGRQLWDNDVAEKDGRYFLYFSLKDKNDVFHLGVATADKPEGPFMPQPDPIRGSYSIDPCAFTDGDGVGYLVFGGLWGGQLQRYRANKAIERPCEPADAEPALCPRIVRLTSDMLQFAEEPRDLVILDECGKPLTAGDHDRRFFEASWLFKRGSTYYYMYSTGDTHLLCYATSAALYGPYTYRGVILHPVVGWTTHAGICEYGKRWWLFFHDSAPSGGRTWLRSLKVSPLSFRKDGTIVPPDAPEGRGA